MESVSRYEEEEDEDEFARRDISAQIDGKNVEQKQPVTPRSKHSATEQRRRIKINDRFQILRELIPHSDQKRDKASFLLEVIEYIRFLQEKVQKYESYPEMQWNNAQGPNDVPAAPGYIYPGNDNNITASTTIMSNLHNAEIFANNITSQPQSQWLRPCTVDGAVNNNVVNEQEELIIDEGTINLSHAYSQELLNTLTKSLESSGLDMSQGSMSVQINLAKRAKKPATATASSAKDPSFGNQSVAGSSDEELDQLSKRHKADNNNNF